jgi:hypothetical protein
MLFFSLLHFGPFSVLLGRGLLCIGLAMAHVDGLGVFERRTEKNCFIHLIVRFVGSFNDRLQLIC